MINKKTMVQIKELKKRAYRFKSVESRHIEACKFNRARNIRLLQQQDDDRQMQIGNILSGKMPDGRPINPSRPDKRFGPQPKKENHAWFNAPTLEDLTQEQRDKIKALPKETQEEAIFKMIQLIIFKRRNNLS